MRIRRFIAWWLERAGDRRTAHAHRIHRWAEDNGVKLSGALESVDLDARSRFRREHAAGSKLRVAAEQLRRREVP